MHDDTPGAAALHDGALCMLSLQPLPEPGGTAPREGAALLLCAVPCAMLQLLGQRDLAQTTARPGHMSAQ